VISAENSDRSEPRLSAALEGSLAGRMAVVTGASSGIGRAIAEELASRGASLCLLGRRPEILRTIAPGLSAGARKLVYKMDLAEAVDIQKLAHNLAREGSGADILVHSAGVISLGDLEEAPVEEFDRQISINLRAPYLLTRTLLAQLKARRGQIVFINSSAGICAVPGSGSYSATKHGLTGLADSLRAEVNGQVRVTSIFTGSTATPMQASLHALKCRAYAPETLIQPEDVASVVCHVLTLPRTVELTAVHMRPAQPPGLPGTG
jgi:NADP-dependent 3-hydroxy acid dehydrogenase YdfG